MKGESEINVDRYSEMIKQCSKKGNYDANSNKNLSYCTRVERQL